MLHAIQVEEKLVTEQCCRCGIHFAMPEYLQKRRRQDKDLFYCPNGHGQYYAKSNVEKAQQELEIMKQRLQAALARENELRVERNKLKIDKDKLKRRISGGTCPCCKRTFKQLAAHIENKHPEYSKINKK